MDNYLYWFIVSHYNLFEKLYRNANYNFTKSSFKDMFVYMQRR